jgi:acyl-homoserine lactone synthase
LEIDRFDDEFAVYLLARSPEDGRHLASLRLLPTTRPHLLNTVFLDLCEEGAPTGECIWEISRLLTTPHVRTGQSALKLHRLLALALAEFASLNEVSAFTLVIEATRLPALLSIGWTIIPLGLPTIVQGQELVALSIDASPASLASLRARLQMAGPALRARALMRSAA